MAVETIDIVVRESGSQAAAQNIRGLGTASQTTAASVNTNAAAVTSYNGVLRSLMPTMSQVTTLAATLGVTLGGAAIVQGVRNLSDEYTQLINRLRLVSTSSDELIKTEQSLFDIAQRTRNGFAETTSFYTKLAMNASVLGIEQSRLLKSTELVNMAVAASGSTAQSAAAGLIQFTQGLSSNRFAGEELRSVMENIPNLAAQIAKGLGVGLGEFRKMAEEGKLTAKTVLDALDKSADGIRAQFASIAPTLSQSFTVLYNSLLRLLGIFDQTNGISGALARGILALANSIGFVAQTAGVAAAGLASLFIARQVATAFAAMQAAIAAATASTVVFQGVAITTATRLTAMQFATGLVTAAMTGLRNATLAAWAVLAANPFTVVVAAIGAAVAAVYLWGNSIKLNASGTITLLGAVVGSWRLLVEAFNAGLGIIGSAWNRLVALFNEGWNFVVGLFNRAIAALEPWLGPIWNAITAAARVMFEYLGGAFEGILTLLSRVFGVFEGASSAFSKFGEKVRTTFEKATADMGKTGLAAADLGKNFKDAGDSATGMGGSAKKAIEDIKLGEAAKAWIPEMTAELNQARDAFGNLIQVQDEWQRRSGALFNKESSPGGVAGAPGGGTGGIGGGGSGGGSSGGSSGQTFGFTAPIGGGSGPFQVRTGPLTPQEADALAASGVDIGAFKALLAKEAGIGASLVDTFNLKDFMRAQNERAQAMLKEMGYTFRNGGSFIVGGNSSGVDNQLVQFMATPGERVIVQTSSQQRAEGRAAPRGEAPVYVSINVHAKDVDSFKRTEDQLVAQLSSKLKRVNRRSANA